MKLKVVLCIKEEWIEVDTIDTLKASIMSRFYLTAGELSRRHLLVRDNRNLIGYPPIITGCFDLLELKDDGSTTLNDCCCEDGDTLVLGMKGPCIVRLVTDFVFEYGHNIEFDNSFTLGQFKREIQELTRKPVTKDNLPEVLFEGDDRRPLLYFGFYRIRPVPDEYSDFMIFPDPNNRPVSKYPVLRLVKRDDNGNEFVNYYAETRPAKSKKEIDEYMATMKRKIQLQHMKAIENRKKKEKKLMKKKKKNDDNNNNNKEAKLLTDLS